MRCFEASMPQTGHGFSVSSLSITTLAVIGITPS